jgi:NADPH2:quinone reductase
MSQREIYPDPSTASLTGDDVRVIEIAEPGPPEVLRLAERPTPEPGRLELLIKVAAAGVNRPDVLQRLGRYPPPPGVTDVPGLEVSGTIVGLGPDVFGWREGDEVCALLAGGGYAEYCVVPAPQCLMRPSALTAIEAAAVPETFFTVWHNVFERGRLGRGETLLVHGGASGIGTAAIQLGKALGARVVTTAGSDERCRACEAIGADLAVPHTGDWASAIGEALGPRPVDVVLDMVGGNYTQQNLDLLATEGRLVQIAFLKSARVEIDLMQVMRQRLTITGSTLRPRPPEEKGAIARALHAHVWPLFEAGTVKPIVHAVFPLAGAADAHRTMEARTHIGKIVLDVLA